MPISPVVLDDLDRRLLALFSAEPQVGVLEASRRLGVARGTVQARLNRLDRTGVVRTWAPTVAPEALGYFVTAFVTLEIVQHEGRERVRRHLESIPQVLECWTVTGTADLWCRIVGTSNEDLQRVVDAMVAHPGIVRTASTIGLSEQIRYRTAPLVARADS